MSSQRTRRAVITGLGVVSPVGIGVNAFWHGLMQARTGLRKIQTFDVSSFPTQLAAQIDDFQASTFLSERQQRYFSRGTQMALVATRMALRDALFADLDPIRTDVVIGAAISSFEEIESQVYGSPSSLKRFEKGVVEPTGMIRAFINAPAAAIALESGAKGYVTTVSSACTSALNAVATAAQRIKDGHADVAITGGVETPITRIILNAYCAANFLTHSHDPETALCPFDKRRTKSALGEGAAIFILEEEQHAIARGVEIYAEVSSFAQATENVNELFMMDRTGAAWAEVMKQALAGRVPSAINAHGPSDTHIDRTEANALRIAIGRQAERIPVFSIKGSVGSGMASAGALQVAAGALAVKHHEIPPVFNYREHDEECGLSCTRERMQIDLDTLLINAHGIGGTNASLVLTRFSI